MEKKYFGYIRVSTAKQGEKGVSLQEQKDAILQYAQRYGLSISHWFEERESAAKRGRALFTQMMKQLQRGNARGVIIHKIDRSARNLKDWADLGELIDVGVEVHFANESLDLNTRGGRLSADIQAVVASDFDTTGSPITLRFARQVGGIMAEAGQREPSPSFRFYM
jgi:site-specific DNA recombinase